MAIEFNKEFYLQSKFNQLEAEGLLEEFGLTSVEELATYFAENGVDAEEHYLNYGMSERINPSAEFDTNAYLEAKLAELQDVEKYGDTYAGYTVEDVIVAFQDAGLTPLAHFNAYGADEGLEAKPVDGDAGAPSELTEDLEAYETAVAAREEAAGNFEELVEGAPAAANLLNGEDFDIEDAADYIERAEDFVANQAADLADERRTTFDADADADAGFQTLDAGDTSTGFDAADDDLEGFYNTDLIDNGDRLSDAKLATLVSDAQAALRADSNRYDDEGNVLYRVTADDLDPATDGELADSADLLSEGDFITGAYAADGDVVIDDAGDYSVTGTGDDASFEDADAAVIADDVFSARQLQSKYNAAVSTLRGDVDRNGETLTIASTLSDAIGAFLAQNADEWSLATVQTDYLAVVSALETAKGNVEADAVQTALGTWKGSVNTAIGNVFDIEGFTAENRDDVSLSDADEDVSSAIVNLLNQLNTRFENDEAVDKTMEALANTPSGYDFLSAEALLDAREKAISDLADAETLLDALEAANTAYEDAIEAVDAAAEALGYEVVEVDDGILFGTEESDLFIFNAEQLDDLGFANITLEELGAGDALFFGTDYSLGGETGDNNALEFFVTTNTAGNVVLEVENSAFGSAQDDDFTVTLTGISEDQLNIEGGVVSIVEVA